MRSSFTKVKPQSLLATKAQSVGATCSVVLSLLGILSAPAQAFQTAARSLPELARDASSIIVGTVVSARAHHGDSLRRHIVTEYTIRIDERLDVPPDEAAKREVTITYWGGTLENRTQRIAGLSYPEVDRRYVFFFRPGTAAVGVPVVGGDQGLLRVERDGDNGDVVRSAQGDALWLDPQHRMSHEPSTRSAPLSLRSLSELLRQRLPEFRRLPVEAPASAPSWLTALRRPDTSTPSPTPLRVPTERPRSHRAADEPALPSRVGAQSVSAAPSAGASSAKPIVSSFAYSGVARSPILISQLPPGGIAPEDQYAMSLWNYYTPDLFQVYAAPLATWAWGNGVFDIAGFVDESTMSRQFGTTWAALGFIAVTFTSIDGSGTIVEADVAINPSTTWTLDDEAVHNGSSSQGLRQMFTHELGHVLGLKHQFNYLSIMNYPPGRFGSAILPYMDDAAGARAGYPGRAAARTDLGVYLYYSAGYQDWREATIPASARLGSTIRVNDYQIENAGTTRVAAPQIEWYLTTKRNFGASYYYLGTSTYSGGLDPFHFFTPSTVDVNLRIPTTVPPGSYYLAAFIRGDGSPSTAAFQRDNNRSFSHSRISISR